MFFYLIFQCKSKFCFPLFSASTVCKFIFRCTSGFRNSTRAVLCIWEHATVLALDGGCLGTLNSSSAFSKTWICHSAVLGAFFLASAVSSSPCLLCHRLKAGRSSARTWLLFGVVHAPYHWNLLCLPIAPPLFTLFLLQAIVSLYWGWWGNQSTCQRVRSPQMGRWTKGRWSGCTRCCVSAWWSCLTGGGAFRTQRWCFWHVLRGVFFFGIGGGVFDMW